MPYSYVKLVTILVSWQIISISTFEATDYIVLVNTKLNCVKYGDPVKNVVAGNMYTLKTQQGSAETNCTYKFYASGQSDQIQNRLSLELVSFSNISCDISIYIYDEGKQPTKKTFDCTSQLVLPLTWKSNGTAVIVEYTANQRAAPLTDLKLNITAYYVKTGLTTGDIVGVTCGALLAVLVFGLLLRHCQTRLRHRGHTNFKILDNSDTVFDL